MHFETYHATDIIYAADDSTGVIAALNSAVHDVARYAADITTAADIGIRHTDIPYGAAGYSTEQAHFVGFTIIEVQAADGKALAIEGACVIVIVFAVSDGGPCSEIRAVTVECAVRSQHIFVDRDVVSQNAVDRGVTADNLCGKPVEFTGIIDLVVAVGVRVISRLIYIAVGAEAVFIFNSFIVVCLISFPVAFTAEAAECLIGTSRCTAGMCFIIYLITADGADLIMGAVAVVGVGVTMPMR